jgi:hypothetical protein
MHSQRRGKTVAFVQILVIRLSECASTPALITEGEREGIYSPQTNLIAVCVELPRVPLILQSK